MTTPAWLNDQLVHRCTIKKLQPTASDGYVGGSETESTVQTNVPCLLREKGGQTITEDVFDNVRIFDAMVTFRHDVPPISKDSIFTDFVGDTVVNPGPYRVARDQGRAISSVVRPNLAGGGQSCWIIGLEIVK
jgi:hypothetical protein